MLSSSPTPSVARFETEFRSSRRIVRDSLLFSFSFSFSCFSFSFFCSFSFSFSLSCLPPPSSPLLSFYRCYLFDEKISSKFRDNGRRWVSERGKPRRKTNERDERVTPMTTADRPFELVKRLGHRSANDLSTLFQSSHRAFLNRFTIRRDQLPFFVYCIYIKLSSLKENGRSRRSVNSSQPTLNEEVE